jgi:hypothetical protein
MKTVLDSLTQEKIVIKGGDYSEIHKLVALENLEEKFGGQMETKTDNFFPPNMDC